MTDPDLARNEALHCLGGRPPPPALRDGLRLLLEFSAPARAQLWGVLGPAIAGPPGPALDQRLVAFAREHELPVERLDAALAACKRFVVAACREDAQPLHVAADLALLCRDDEASAVTLRECLLPGYATAKTLVRRRLVEQTISDHGALLTGVDWRVDRVIASQHGEHLNAPVGVITLHLREGTDERRITVHATVERLRELHRVCAKLLS